MANKKTSTEDRRKNSTIHGKSFSRVYRSWRAMLDRCYRKSDPSYFRYGERGITVCDSWFDFNNFYKDMGDPPDGHTIDRINNNGHYHRDNCRWANARTQSNNRRSNKYIVINGENLTLAEAARKLGIKRSTFHKRIQKYKYSPEELLLGVGEKRNLPVAKNKKDNTNDSGLFE